MHRSNRLAHFIARTLRLQRTFKQHLKDVVEQLEIENELRRLP